MALVPQQNVYDKYKCKLPKSLHTFSQLRNQLFHHEDFSLVNSVGVPISTLLVSRSPISTFQQEDGFSESVQ